MKIIKINLPTEIYKQWEDAAVKDGITYIYFKEYIKDKEKQYIENLKKEKKQVSMYTNEKRNKFTEFGNKKALEFLQQIPKIERVVKFANFDFKDLQKNYQELNTGKIDKEIFYHELKYWYKNLKEKMFLYKISKETLLKYGLDYKKATVFYFDCLKDLENKL